MAVPPGPARPATPAPKRPKPALKHKPKPKAHEHVALAKHLLRGGR